MAQADHLGKHAPPLRRSRGPSTCVFRQDRRGTVSARALLGAGLRPGSRRTRDPHRRPERWLAPGIPVMEAEGWIRRGKGGIRASTPLRNKAIQGASSGWPQGALDLHFPVPDRPHGTPEQLCRLRRRDPVQLQPYGRRIASPIGDLLAGKGIRFQGESRYLAHKM
jgi:hypothetical protein